MFYLVNYSVAGNIVSLSPNYFHRRLLVITGCVARTASFTTSNVAPFHALIAWLQVALSLLHVFWLKLNLC